MSSSIRVGCISAVWPSTYGKETVMCLCSVCRSGMSPPPAPPISHGKVFNSLGKNIVNWQSYRLPGKHMGKLLSISVQYHQMCCSLHWVMAVTPSTPVLAFKLFPVLHSLPLSSSVLMCHTMCLSNACWANTSIFFPFSTNADSWSCFHTSAANLNFSRQYPMEL